MAIMLLILCAYLFTLGTTAVIEPVFSEDESEETFILDGLEYSFQRRPLSWRAAKLDCETKNQSLAKLNTAMRSKFVAVAMAELFPDGEDLWIGARLDAATKEWRWYQDNSVLPVDPWEGVDHSSYQELVEPIQGVSQGGGEKCVALDRRKHDHPLFVGLPCELSRGFICEASPVNTRPREISSAWINGTKYTLYRARLSWQDAVGFCQEMKQHIASVSNPEALHWIAQKMLHVRPVMETAWLGGIFSERHQAWEWVTSGHPLQVTDTHSPWPSPPPNHTGCLLLDRHLCSKPVVIAANCRTLKNVVCQSTEVTSVRVEVRHNGSIHFIVVEPPQSWYDAQVRCLEKTEHGRGRLLTLQHRTATPEFLKMLTTAMAEATKEVVHIWLGGRYDAIKRRWFWVEDHRRVYFDEKLLKVGRDGLCFLDDTGMQLGVDSPCLNLDRDNFNNIVLYSLPCNISQAFVCYYSDQSFAPAAE